MKTLIIAEFTEKREISIFRKEFLEVITRNDVIFTGASKDIDSFENIFSSQKSDVTTVVISSHGGENEIPFMYIAGEDIKFTEVIKMINAGEENAIQRIHLTSCHIGHNLDNIQQELLEFLEDKQLLFLHGDTFSGDIIYSLDQRLTGIAQTNSYTIGEAILDSPEAMSVILRLPSKGLETSQLAIFSYEIFDPKTTGYSIASMTAYLQKALNEAHAFSIKNGLPHNNQAQQKLDSWHESDFISYLGRAFFRNLQKFYDQGDSLVPLIQSLIQSNDLSPNIVNQKGFTALHFAAREGLSKIAELLMAKGANPNIADTEGLTPLRYACDGNHVEMVKSLLKDQTINVNAQNPEGFSSLMIAASQGYQEIVQALLADDRIDINLQNEQGFTALHFAASKGLSKIAELLMAEGANPNIADTDGFTPLQYACTGNRVEVVKSLLKDPTIDVNAKDQNGWTSLLSAAARGYQDIVQALLADDRIDVTQRTNDGKTALEQSATNGRTQVSDLISKHIQMKKEGLSFKEPSSMPKHDTLDAWEKNISYTDFKDITKASESATDNSLKTAFAKKQKESARAIDVDFDKIASERDNVRENVEKKTDEQRNPQTISHTNVVTNKKGPSPQAQLRGGDAMNAAKPISITTVISGGIAGVGLIKAVSQLINRNKQNNNNGHHHNQ